MIIPVFEDRDRLALCLAALARQTLPADAFEVLVVNNAVTAIDLPIALANARLLEESAPGSYAARNLGVRAASGGLLAFTDSDCIPAPGWLEAAVAAVASTGGRRHVTGPISIFRPSGGRDLPYLHDRHLAFYSNKPPGTVVCANLIVPRPLFERIGPFDETRYSGGDTDWNQRAMKQGIDVWFSPPVAVDHPARGTVAELQRKERRFAGAAAMRRDLSPIACLLKYAKPPVNRVRAIVGPTPRERFRLFWLLWWLRFSYLCEYLLVFFALHTPERR